MLHQTEFCPWFYIVFVIKNNDYFSNIKYNTQCVLNIDVISILVPNPFCYQKSKMVIFPYQELTLNICGYDNWSLKTAPPHHFFSLSFWNIFFSLIHTSLLKVSIHFYKWLPGRYFYTFLQLVSQLDPWVRKIPWRRKGQPTPVYLPGKFHGQWRLVG